MAGLFAGSYTYAMANPTPRFIPTAVTGIPTSQVKRAEFVAGMEEALGASLKLQHHDTFAQAKDAVEEQRVFAILREPTAAVRDARRLLDRRGRGLGLGALRLPFAEPWAILARTMFPSGMVFTMFNTLVGRWAMLPTWGLMVLLGSPSSGGAVSWPLLPSLLGRIGRWLPPGGSVNAQHHRHPGGR